MSQTFDFQPKGDKHVNLKNHKHKHQNVYVLLMKEEESNGLVLIETMVKESLLACPKDKLYNYFWKGEEELGSLLNE